MLHSASPANQTEWQTGNYCQRYVDGFRYRDEILGRGDIDWVRSIANQDSSVVGKENTPRIKLAQLRADFQGFYNVAVSIQC